MSRIKVAGVWVCSLLACLLLLAEVARGHVEVLIQGATDEENREISSLFNRCGYNQANFLSACNELLERKPGNRPVRLHRASLLMRMGKMEEAKADLQHLRSKSPEFLLALNALESFWKIKGDRQRQLAALKERDKQKPSDPAQARMAKAAGKFNKFRIAELSGNFKEAESLREKIIEQCHPQIRRP
ncbi:MAG: hypothetical protein QGD94_10875 [Planctomycetia bacterium]|nr:hypothetical protein [Planctomycetia bacterium]